MSEPVQPVEWMREELLGLLGVSATLAGLSVTVVAFMKTAGSATRAATVTDDMFALCAVLFLVDTYLIFWALTTRRQSLSRRLLRVLDVTFLAALTLMTMAAVIMVYTVW